MGRKVLVAFDESDNAMRAVDFVCQHFTSQHRITLFCVIADTTAYCNIGGPGLTPYFIAQKDAFCDLEEKKKAIIREAMEKARKKLMDAGFEDKNISLKTEIQKKGVARDIIEEAADYDIIVIGRRGLSGIQQFLMGSVSQKVLHGMGDTPIIMVG